MTAHDERAVLHDIRAALGRMQRYVAGLDKDAFLANDEKGYAVLAQLIIIGEATNRLSEATREAAVDIPWRQMIGTRNRVVHGYDAIDWNIVWDIATIHAPALEKSIDALLSAR